MQLCLRLEVFLPLSFEEYCQNLLEHSVTWLAPQLSWVKKNKKKTRMVQLCLEKSNKEMVVEQDRWLELVEVRLVVPTVSGHLAIERRTTIRDWRQDSAFNYQTTTRYASRN